MNEKERHVRI